MVIGGLERIIVDNDWDHDPNTPFLSYSNNLEDGEALIRPLKGEKMRDRLMPSPMLLNKQTSKSGDLHIPSRRNSSLDAKRAISALANPIRPFDLPEMQASSKKDDEIIDLKLQVTGLKKENTELRLMLNYFMQLAFDKQ